MIKRDISEIILNDALKYPAIAIMGPRQSGKTTLVKKLFENKKYVNLEDFDQRDFAEKDPKGFLSQHGDGLIIDEAQRVPNLFSYIQVDIDQDDHPGKFILTGSQNFLLMENLSQSLAGRVSIFKLFPLSLNELQNSPYFSANLEENIFKGFYPKIFDKSMDPVRYYPNYIQTYIERDVRQIKNIGSMSSFQNFLKLCAGRAGQLVNYSSLADDAGISHNTVKSWLSILEASFIIFLLKPHHNNLNKRLVKMPKLYFLDTGLLCSLLLIEKKEQLESHHLKGSIFENLIISDLLKRQLNQGRAPSFYFWRDNHGKEIDLLIEKAEKVVPIEIKSGKTISSDFLNNLAYYRGLNQDNILKEYLIYGGDQRQDRENVLIRNWGDFGEVLE